MVKFVAPLLSLLIVAQPLYADTVTLNSGEEHHGKIIRENETEVVMEIKVSSSILDQRTFQRSEIKELSKTPADENEFKKVRLIKTASDSLAPAEYNRRIEAIDGFLRRFPDSTHTAEVKKNREELDAERTRVTEKEEFKWSNRWYPKEEAEELAYQIAATQLFHRMRDLSIRHDLLGALNTFDHLEKNFPGAKVLPEAIALAAKLIPSVSVQAERASTNFKIQEQKYKEGIVLLAEPAKGELIAAREAEAKTTREAYAAATHLKWKPFFGQVDASIKGTKELATAEIARLRELPVGDMRKSLALTEKAESQINSGDLASAQASLEEGKALWPANELLTRLDKKVTSAIEEQKAQNAAVAAAEAEAQKKAAEEKAAAEKQQASNKGATPKK